MCPTHSNPVQRGHSGCSIILSRPGRALAPSWDNGGTILALSWHCPAIILLCMARAWTGTVVLVLGLCLHGIRDGASRKHRATQCRAAVPHHTDLHHRLLRCTRPCCDTPIPYHAFPRRAPDVPCRAASLHPACSAAGPPGGAETGAALLTLLLPPLEPRPVPAPAQRSRQRRRAQVSDSLTPPGPRHLRPASGRPVRRGAGWGN